MFLTVETLELAKLVLRLKIYQFGTPKFSHKNMFLWQFLLAFCNFTFFGCFGRQMKTLDQRAMGDIWHTECKMISIDSAHKKEKRNNFIASQTTCNKQHVKNNDFFVSAA